MQRLPPEIIGEIFLWSVRRKELIIFTNDDLLCILRVCRTWRDVAICTPQLWSLMKIRLNSPYSVDEICMLETWLTRSGACALGLNIESDEERADTELRASRHKVMRALLPHLPRCTRLFAALSAELWNVIFISPNAPRFSQLVFLLLEIFFLRGDVVQEPSFNLSAYPQLATLHYICYHPTVGVDFQGLGISIKSIHATVVDGRNVIKLLRCCPSLTRCDVSVETDYVETDVEHPPTSVVQLVQLTHLEELKINGDAETSLQTCFILNKLALPSLRVLHLDSGDSFEEDERRLLRGLGTLLQRSRSPLKELRVSSYSLNMAQLVSCLAFVPILATLTIDARFIDVRLWRALTLVNDPSDDLPHNMCPCLEYLKVKQRGMPNSTISETSVVAEMILSRCLIPMGSTLSSFKPLTMLHLENVPVDRDELLTYPGVERCAEAGLDIVLR